MARACDSIAPRWCHNHLSGNQPKVRDSPSRAFFILFIFYVAPGGLAVLFQGRLLRDGFLFCLAGAWFRFALGVGIDCFLSRFVAHNRIYFRRAARRVGE
jgi:hypothetical protein